MEEIHSLTLQHKMRISLTASVSLDILYNKVSVLVFIAEIGNVYSLSMNAPFSILKPLPPLAVTLIGLVLIRE